MTTAATATSRACCARLADVWSATGSRNSHWKRVHDGYSQPDGGIVMKGFVYVIDTEGGLRIR